MLSSRYIAEIIPAELWDRYSAMEMDMILAFARRARDMDYTALWYADKLRAMGMLRDDLEAIIRRNWPGTQKELAGALEQAGFRSLSADEKTYQRAVELGLLQAAPPISESVPLKRILDTGYRQALNKLNLTNTTAVNTTIDALDRAYTLANIGFNTLDQSIFQAVNELASRGIVGARYPSGREMELAPYVRMVVRTSIMQTTQEISFTRADEFGSDLIEVSAHAGARPKCAPYQGKVYSRSGKHKKYPPFSSTSYGAIDGLFGINCGHYPFPFIEGLDEAKTAKEIEAETTVDGKSNEQVYAESQGQRYYERKIREWKHKAAALETAAHEDPALQPAAHRARAKVREWQAEQRAFIEKTGRTRRYDREKTGPVVQVPKEAPAYIRFERQASVEDASLFAMQMNVKADYSDGSVRVANYINRGLALADDVKITLPANVSYNLADFPGTYRKESPMGYRADTDTLTLNPAFKWNTLKSWIKDGKDDNYFSSGHYLYPVWHELGHVHMAKTNKTLWDSVKSGARVFTAAETQIALSVGKYAAYSPLEFVSEVFAGIAGGIRYSESIMKLYRDLGGKVW